MGVTIGKYCILGELKLVSPNKHTKAVSLTLRMDLPISRLGNSEITVIQWLNKIDLSKGVKYGARIKSGVVGVFLNMKKGTLSFNVD